MYLSFKQWLIYSKQSIQAVDLIRKTVKWSIPLQNIAKLHINYPVIITFSRDGTLVGYDFFTGFELWKKSSSYSNLFESEVDVWMVTNDGIERIDVVSSEVIQRISLDKPVKYLYGNDLFLYLQFEKSLVHFNLLTQSQVPVGDGFRVVDRVSDFILVGSDEVKQLRTFSNQIISENIQEELFKIHSPTTVFFSFIRDDILFFITKNGVVPYEFTRSKNNDKINYGYRLDDSVRIFQNDEQHVWKLKHKKKKESVQDT